jgi:hypothetical protein
MGNDYIGRLPQGLLEGAIGQTQFVDALAVVERVNVAQILIGRVRLCNLVCELRVSGLEELYGLRVAPGETVLFGQGFKGYVVRISQGSAKKERKGRRTRI